MASASAVSSARPAPSTSSKAENDKAKTYPHHSMALASCNNEQKSHNVIALPVQPPVTSTNASSAFIDFTSSVNCPERIHASNVEACPTDRLRQGREEAPLALAQQQVQQYKAMTKQLEAQSGILMTPSTIATDCNGNALSVAGLAKTSETLQKRRQEQLAKLQQNVQRQAAMAAHAVQKRSNDEWLRNKLQLEQDHLRLLRLHDHQAHQTNKGNTVSTATATSIADSLLAQQQQVMRQQHLLRDMLQKQQKQQKLQLQLKMRLQNGSHNPMPSVGPATPVQKTLASCSPSSYSVKKRKLKSAFEIDLESLAKVCIRVASARTDCEMRQALDKMTSWLHQCTEVLLLQIAARDYRDSLAHRRPMLMQQNRWPVDLQVKSEGITRMIGRLLEAFALREKKQTAQQEAVERGAEPVSAALAASGTIVLHSGPNEVIRTTAARSSPVSAFSPPSSTVLASSVHAPVERNAVAVEREYAEVKAQLQVKQVETNQKAKAKRDAAKLEASKTANCATSNARMDAPSKGPLQLAPDLVKPPPTEAIGTPSTPLRSLYRPVTTTVSPISPRVAQQFYDLDVATRASTESDDKMYLPSKAVSKIMYRALPCAPDLNRGTTGTTSTCPPRVQALERSFESIHISEDAVTFMQECVTEFLLYFTSEARDFSVVQNRRTKKGLGLSISGANVVEGMENLGLTAYARVLAGYNDKVKACQEAALRKKMERKKAVQRQAFEEAAAGVKATPGGVRPLCGEGGGQGTGGRVATINPITRPRVAVLETNALVGHGIPDRTAASEAGAAAASSTAARNGVNGK